MNALIILGGDRPSAALLRTLAGQADFVLCADSGLAAAQAAGVVPDAVIGDMDSVPDEALRRYAQAGNVLRLPCEKDDTDGVAALEEGGISDVVESSSGYHILMREPVTPDDLVLLGTAQPYTLRYAAAVMDYNTTFTGWTDSAEVVYADEFADFEPAQLFE